MHVCAKLLQFYLTLCDPIDYGPPGSSVYGILQARIVEWVFHAILQGTYQLRDQLVSLTSPALASGLFTTGSTWEAHKEL